MTRLSEKEQNKLIAAEIKKLMEAFEGISENKRKVATRLIERVSFMKITLEVLEGEIKSLGPTYLFEQGAQKMIIENPAQKSYNTMINRYVSACNSLFNLLPKEVATEDDDGFEAFLNAR